MLTINILGQLWPHGDAKIPGLMNGIATAAPTIFPKYGLTSDLLVAHAMAQFSEECGAGTEVEENLNYSAQGLINTWPSRFNPAKAAQFAGHAQQIANEVYNGRMGNAPNSNDGWNFRGRGGSQLTGRDNYFKLGQRLSLDLLGNSALVNDPAHFLECAVADFIQCGCLPFAIHDDISGVTYHLNGGYIGLSKRTDWLARWKAALGVNLTDPPVHGAAWVQQSLNQLGEEPPLSIDGSFGPLTSAALKEFQRANNLPPSGLLDPATEQAIERKLGAP
jgi:putative chitinase